MCRTCVEFASIVAKLIANATTIPPSPLPSPPLLPGPRLCCLVIIFLACSHVGIEFGTCGRLSPPPDAGTSRHESCRPRRSGSSTDILSVGGTVYLLANLSPLAPVAPLCAGDRQEADASPIFHERTGGVEERQWTENRSCCWRYLREMSLRAKECQVLK